MQFLGINKGEHHSGVALLTADGDAQVFSKERFCQKKNAGGMPFSELAMLGGLLNGPVQIADNSFGQECRRTEELWEENFPFLALLEKRGQAQFSAIRNPHIRFIPHHEAHAWAAVAQSPFDESLILVLDGVGQDVEAFPPGHPERLFLPAVDGQQKVAESGTLYWQQGPKLNCVDKIWQYFVPDFRLGDDEDPEDFSTGLGYFYSLAAKFIFNSFHESGKVMGLAAWGESSGVPNDLLAFWQQQDWSKRFLGCGKKDWQDSVHRKHWSDLAATVQETFEQRLLQYLNHVKSRFPHVDHVILTGGCALNCVANQKVLEAGPFKHVYIPPFPSDEGISYGLAHALLLSATAGEKLWRPTSLEHQPIYLGPKSSAPNDKNISQVFAGYSKNRCEDIAKSAAELLAQGKIIGWFQGRSETGPRALGHRSILADPRLPQLKARLNRDIKKREDFRPYGASLRQDLARQFFCVDADFSAPFMSFAPRLRTQYRELLQEIAHVDGSCRIQTLLPQQNPLFYRLLQEFEASGGPGILLNTSLNVMGRPIAETVEHAAEFLKSSCVDALVVGNWIVYPPSKE